MSPVTGNLELERTYPVSCQRVFAAWASAEAMLVWSAPPPGWDMRCDAFELAVGHTDEWRFGPVGEEPYVNRNAYVAVEQDRRIVYTTTLAHGEALQFAGAVSVTLEPVGEGCRLRLAETGFHIGQDDRDGHAEGWRSMLDALGDYLAEPVAG